MTLTEHVYRLAARVPFEPGTATPPSEGAKTVVGTLWGYAAWVIPVIACFALIGAVVAFFKHRSNGNNEGAEKAAWVMAGCIAFGFIPSLVGTVTGT